MEGGVSNLAVVIKPQGRQGAAWLQTFGYALGGALGAVIGRTAASLLPYDAEWLTDLATLGYDLWYACPDVSLGCEVIVQPPRRTPSSVRSWLCLHQVRATMRVFT